MNPMARLAGTVSLFAIAACTSASPSSPFGPSASGVVAPQEKPPLAALQTRDRIVSLYGDHGALFVSVRDDAGNVVADALSLEELRAVDPFLYQACTSAFAKNGTYLDARLYPMDLGASDATDSARAHIGLSK